MQHAYDTRLKRDVAIKCIKITASDITKASRSQISIHDAQIANASRPLSDLKRESASGSGSSNSGGLPWEDGVEPIGGFIPLTVKFEDPSFLDKNEERRANRARRHSILRDRRATANIQRQQAKPSYDRGAIENNVSMDLSDFEGYSNFKGPSGRRRPTPYAESLTIGFKEFSEIPGKIQGAGEVQIDAIGNGVAADISSDYSSRSEHGEESGGNREASATSPREVASSNQASRSAWNNESERAEVVDLNKLDNIPGLEEARTAAHLNDANIVTVYDCVVEGDMAYVIMEYVEGKTLAKILRELGNDITLDMIAAVFSSVSHALEVAHKANVLHLDVKPENVIVNREGVVKVTDFGLSTLMDASGQGVTGGGTIGYMPLEQMRQQRLDVRTDEWALASLTYEMLSGKNPFKARTLPDAEAAIEGAELVIPSLCWEQIDENIDDVMFDALSPDMDGRYSDIKSFADELKPMLGNPRDGSKQLAEVVRGKESLFGESALDKEDAKGKGKAKDRGKSRPAKPHTPFIDKLGMRGSSIVMRLFAALGTAMIVVISCMNFRFTFGRDASVSAGSDPTYAAGPDTTFGLFSIMPEAAWIMLVLLVALAIFRPRWVFVADVAVFFIMLAFNQAWLPGIILIVAAGAWWWFLGRESDMMCTLVLLQPLLGSVGFVAIVPVLAGALLDIRDAIATAAMAAVGAMVFAAFGSASVMDWNVMSNFIIAINPSIAGAAIAHGFLDTLSSAQNWVVIASWLLAAGAYALLCRRGTHVFDVIASVSAGVLIVVGILIIPLATGDFSTLTPLTISGAAVAALIGIVFALLNIPDRVRMAPGEW